MMKIQHVSITGADDKVDINDLNLLYEEFSYAEWAILLLPEQMGQNRCPTISWIDDFKKNYIGDHKAMHLCGSALLDFIKGNKDILDLMDGFKRVQLNLGFGDVEGKYDPLDLIAQIKMHDQWEFIIQYTDDKSHLLPMLKDIKNHSILFDVSAGQGISPDAWPEPITGHRCGYAGGLNPENIKKNIELMIKSAGDYITWIDMESGVRTEDEFDLKKVRSVLKTARPYIL